MFSFWKRRRQEPPREEPPRLRIYAEFRTDVGRHREINEDSAAVVQPDDADTLARRGILVVVADGMGGHEAGEVASRMAVETLTRVYYAEPGNPGDALVRGVEEANREVFEFAHKSGLAGMGSTCTALALTTEGAHMAHVGDSRIYLVRRGGIYQVTEDHSAVMELVRQGIITMEDARHHQDRNVLVRALGTRAQLEVSRWTDPMPVFAGDRFVLCSDGLHDGMPEELMRNTVVSHSPAEACRVLVDAALARGGTDNITVAVVAAEPFHAEPASMRETRAVEVTQ